MQIILPQNEIFGIFEYHYTRSFLCLTIHIRKTKLLLKSNAKILKYLGLSKFLDRIMDLFFRKIARGLAYIKKKQ